MFVSCQGPIEDGDAKDTKEYVSHGMSSRNPIKSNGYSRRYKRAAPEVSVMQEIKLYYFH